MTPAMIAARSTRAPEANLKPVLHFLNVLEKEIAGKIPG